LFKQAFLAMQGVDMELGKVQRQFCKTQLLPGWQLQYSTASAAPSTATGVRQLDFVCSYLI
jgi:hypothetical protein